MQVWRRNFAIWQGANEAHITVICNKQCSQKAKEQAWLYRLFLTTP
jgi:hypothetical protein